MSMPVSTDKNDIASPEVTSPEVATLIRSWRKVQRTTSNTYTRAMQLSVRRRNFVVGQLMASTRHI